MQIRCLEIQWRETKTWWFACAISVVMVKTVELAKLGILIALSLLLIENGFKLLAQHAPAPSALLSLSVWSAVALSTRTSCLFLRLELHSSCYIAGHIFVIAATREHLQWWSRADFPGNHKAVPRGKGLGFHRG